MILAASEEGKISQDIPRNTIMGATVDELKIIIPNDDDRGKLEEWLGYATSREE